MKRKLIALLACAVMTCASVGSVWAAPSVTPVDKYSFDAEGEMTVVGGSITEDAERGSVLHLDGGAKGSSYATKDTDVYADTDWSDGMTIAFWVKADTADAGIAPLYSFSIKDHDAEGYIATTDSLEIGINTDGNSGLAEYPRVWADPSVVDATAQPVLPANEWTHIAVTLSGTGMTIYMNGAEYSQPALGPSSANFKLFIEQISYVYGLQLGNWNCGWWEEIGSFAGSYDDVYVFNKSLSADEVTTVMNSNFEDMTATAAPGMNITVIIVAIVAVIVVVAVILAVMASKKKKEEK